MSGPDPGEVARRAAEALARTVVPGVAVGLLDGDGERAWGFGITNVDRPLPVDPDTVFEIASITKTMTATVAARLAASGRLDLDAPVRRFLPAFRVADPDVSARVTVRDLFTHTAGWFGEYLGPTGRGDGAIARGVAQLPSLEQVTPFGVFSYNNVSLTLAGRLIEVVADRPYRTAMRDLLFAPLGMDRSTFAAPFAAEDLATEDLATEDLAADRGESGAAGHTVRDGKAVVVRSRLAEGDGGDPAGGVRSTVRDLLRYARFHLGDGRAPDGTPLLPAAALRAMREPRVAMGGGDHVGLAWFLEERGAVRIAAHGGATVAQMSHLALVPERGAALVILTNGANGAVVCAELAEWLLGGWLGLAPRAVPRPLGSQPDPGPYAGRYRAPLSEITLSAVDGALMLRLAWKGVVAERPTPPPQRLAFTGPDAVVATGPAAAPQTGDFIRAADGTVAYFRWGRRARTRVA